MSYLTLYVCDVKPGSLLNLLENNRFACKNSELDLNSQHSICILYALTYFNCKYLATFFIYIFLDFHIIYLFKFGKSIFSHIAHYFCLNKFKRCDNLSLQSHNLCVVLVDRTNLAVKLDWEVYAAVIDVDRVVAN